MNSRIRSILTEDEIEVFVKAISRDKVILPTIRKILVAKYSELDKPTSPQELEQAAWPLTRAFRDGGRYHISALLKLFEEQK